MRFDFVEVVEVFEVEVFEFFEGAGMSTPSSRLSGRSRCS